MIKRIINKYNLKDQVYGIVFYPVTSIFFNCRTILISLCEIIHSLSKEGKFRMFDEHNAINTYWYDTLTYNLLKHTRFGFSHTTSYQKYPIGNWFHISLFSMYPFWKSSVLTNFICWIFLPLTFCVLFEVVNFQWCCIVLMATFFGSNYYNQLQVQNYNFLGWLIFPLLFWTIDNNDFIYISTIITGLFLTSFTAFIFALGYLACSVIFNDIPISVFFCVLVIVLPFVVYRFSPMIINGTIKKQFLTIAGAIGLYKSNNSVYVRNPRKKSSFLLGGIKVGSVLVFYFFIPQSAPYLYVVLTLLFINYFLGRYADHQSLDMIMLITCLYYLFQQESFISLFVYWVLISNPIPRLNFSNAEGSLFQLKKIKPYDCIKIENKLNIFFSKVKNQKVFIAFDDPCNNYESLFLNQRIILEVSHYFASKNNVLLFPNFWSVFDENNGGGKNFWSKKGIEIIDYSRNINLNFLIYPLINDESLPELLTENFKCIDSINWNSYLNDDSLSNKRISWLLLSNNH